MWGFFSCHTYLKAIWTRCARTSWASSVTRLRSLSCLMKLSSSEALAIQKARAPAMFFCFCKRDGVLSTAREQSHEGQERGSHSHKKQQQSQDRLEPLSDPPSLPHNQTPPADQPERRSTLRKAALLFPLAIHPVSKILSKVSRLVFGKGNQHSGKIRRERHLV